MAQMTGLLKSQLLQDFFTTVNRVRAKGTYTAFPGQPNESINTEAYSQNAIDISFEFYTDADNPSDVAAKLVNVTQGDDPIFVLVDATNNDTFQIDKLEFLDDTDEVYLEWRFAAGELVFTGNGEIHIEDIEIKMG